MLVSRRAAKAPSPSSSRSACASWRSRWRSTSGWVVLTLREIVPLLLGSLVFAAIITGLILNTTFLVREIRRNEQHDAFVNSVTHELKTPVTSIRLHLETLKTRGVAVDDAKRHEFYDVMLHDSDRLMHLIEQVLSAGQKGRVPQQQERIDLRALADDCITLTRTQRHLAARRVAACVRDRANRSRSLAIPIIFAARFSTCSTTP